MKTGTPYIIAAPSGAGKTSLVNRLIKELDNVVVSISHTTRPKRPGEQDDVHYHFVDLPTFKKLKNDNIFLEDAVVFGNSYGTSKVWLEEKLRAGIDVILEIDWQGAKQIRQLIPQTIAIFIIPPSLAILKQRLEERAQDSAEIIEKRILEAKNEIRHYQEFDYLVVNDDFDQALTVLKSIFIAQRHLIKSHQEKHAVLINELTN